MNDGKGDSVKKFLLIQDEVIVKYNIDICNGSKCKNDWHRTHAHLELRRVCKWNRANSINSTFSLFHEIGHIETTTRKMRRCEEEYFATVWAIKKCQEYGLRVPQSIIDRYQNYINLELERGLRRGGSGYIKEQLQLGSLL